MKLNLQYHFYCKKKSAFLINEYIDLNFTLAFGFNTIYSTVHPIP